MSLKTSSRSGFTLVELSVVLVIIGILIGGIMAGRSLVKNAQLRSIPNEIKTFGIAVDNFRDKYRGLPGDLRDATRYWGALSAVSDAACYAVVTPNGKATCNGDGDGKVQRIGAATYAELDQVFQHLSNAGMIPGDYFHAGSPGGCAGGTLQSPTNTKFKGSAYFFAHPNVGTSYTSTTNLDIAGTARDMLITDPQSHLFYFGNPTTAVSNCPNEPVGGIITAMDAQTLDSKFDDGLPATGMIIAPRDGATPTPSCTTTTTPASQYDTAQTTKVCSLFFKYNKQ